MPNIVQMKKARTEELMKLKEMAEDSVGLPCHEIEATMSEITNQTITNRLKIRR